MTGFELIAAAEKATARCQRLTDRYNREYAAGKWSTNRPLAGACEDAWDAMVQARMAAGLPGDGLRTP